MEHAGANRKDDMKGKQIGGHTIAVRKKISEAVKKAAFKRKMSKRMKEVWRQRRASQAGKQMFEAGGENNDLDVTAAIVEQEGARTEELMRLLGTLRRLIPHNELVINLKQVGHRYLDELRKEVESVKSYG
jgi:hypothetical protein